ncbi:MAG: heme exporter protein CcmD [Mesorhizobium sp.]
MNHALFVTAAYVVSAISLGGLALWILLDQRARRREIAALEASGIKRRSQGKSA